MLIHCNALWWARQIALWFKIFIVVKVRVSVTYDVAFSVVAVWTEQLPMLVTGCFLCLLWIYEPLHETVALPLVLFDNMYLTCMNGVCTVKLTKNRALVSYNSNLLPVVILETFTFFHNSTWRPAPSWIFMISEFGTFAPKLISHCLTKSNAYDDALDAMAAPQQLWCVTFCPRK